jgi:hypothetical protein
VGLAEDGASIYVTRPGGYGRWNDGSAWQAQPGTPAFEALWGEIGTPIGREVFEAAYAAADARLPETIGGTPKWVSDLIVWLALLIVVALAALGFLLVQVLAA